MVNHQGNLDAALLLAQQSHNPKWRMGCVLYNVDALLVGEGLNSPPALSPPWTEHAEEAALLSVFKDDHNSKPVYAYIARVNRQSKGRLARPCENCAVQLKTAGVREVFWTGVNGELCSGVL